MKQVWDEHLASQSVTKAEPVAELPVEVAEEVALVTKELTQRLAALAIELNDKAVKAAERRVHEVVRSAGEQRAQAERELADASQTVEDLEAMVDEATVQVTGLEAKLADRQTANQAQAVDLAQVRERLTVTEQTAKVAGEQHAAELARMAATIEAERQRHHQEAEQLRAEGTQQKQAHLVVATERDQVRADLAALTAKSEAIEQARQDQRKAAELETQRAAERLAKAEAGQEKAHQEAGAAREEAANLRGQVEATKTQLAELMQVLAANKP
ncbi:coiled-coil domain-containing protein [Rhodoferax antarcticus]|uniref:kfra protein n=1 Tax=Rhodoferax antarcticus TaxID=81479 RepID=UPI002224CC0D|nr:kfra protein [Rhodoferax antarcticus]MCW2314070.1 chromosome segregation ATPase [Rhodoferax antarcticus]